jgi:hypothetical protein
MYQQLTKFINNYDIRCNGVNPLKTKETLVFMMIALVASLLLPSLLSASATNSKAVILPLSGTIVQTTNLNNAIVIYGASTLNNTEISYIRTHFKLLICDFFMSPSVLASLKANNTNFMIFGYCNSIGVYTSNSYWSTVNAQNNWFMHDVNGNRITQNRYGWYLMNPGSSGWQQFYSSYVNSKLNETLFDGVFADDTWNRLVDYISYGSLSDAATNETLSNADISTSVVSDWHSNMISFLQNLEGNIISGKKVIVNTDEYLTNDYLAVVDGKMHEGFAYAPWWPLNYYDILGSMYNPLESINTMARDSATGKIFIAENGVAMPTSLNSATITEIIKNANYCYAATLLGINGTNCYFGYNVGAYYTFNGEADYLPTLVTNLGSPTDSFYQSQGVYMRDFTNGKVLLNLSNNSCQIMLGQNYYLTNGTMVSNVVLGSWSGQILTSS